MDYSFVRKAGYQWHDRVTAALEYVDQGVVLRGVPLVYAASGAFAVLSQTKSVLRDNDGGVQLIVTDAMVTSQTCDLRGPGGKRFPLMMVAPVYAASYLDPSITPAAIGKAAHLVRIDGPAFANGLYIADLRFETTVEKSIVVDREILVGCADPEQRAVLAKKLGERRRRGAVDSRIEQALLEPLETLFRQRVAAEDIYEIRLFGDPSIARANRVRLIIVCERNADVDHIRAVLSEWYDEARERIAEIDFLPLLVESVERVTIDDIRDAIPIFLRNQSDEPTEH